MAVTGLPKLGGEVGSFGAAKGNYHVEVTDAQIAEAKTSGRPQIVIELTVKNDPNNPAKEGKKLTKMFQSLPMEGDDHDKVLTMKGMVKRFVFDGFGLKWETQEKEFDPRKLIGKQAYVQVGDKKNSDGTMGTGVVAVAQTAEALPVPKGVQAAVASAKAPRTGARR